MDITLEHVAVIKSNNTNIKIAQQNNIAERNIL